MEKPIGQIDWFHVEGVLYGKIEERPLGYAQHSGLTLKIEYEDFNGHLPSGLFVISADQAQYGWKWLASCQRFDSSKPNYYCMWLDEKNTELNVKGGVDVLKKHAETLFLMTR